MRAADVYTHGHDDSVLRSHRWRTAGNSAGYLLPHLEAGQRLLDVGCGPGTITVDLARRVAPGQVLGVDREYQPLQEARTHAAEADLGNVAFQVGDVYRLACPDASFDIVHAHQVLQHLSDPVAALIEMRRVCRPGGWVAARDADYAAMTWYPQDPRLDRWLELYRQVARRNSAEPDAGRRLLSWAQQAGLSEVVGSASTWCFANNVDRSWWGGMWADRILHSAMAEQALARDLTDPQELAGISDAWRNLDPPGRRLVRHPARRNPLPGDLRTHGQRLAESGAHTLPPQTLLPCRRARPNRVFAVSSVCQAGIGGPPRRCRSAPVLICRRSPPLIRVRWVA